MILDSRRTLARRGYLRLIRRLMASGWRVELIYLALPNPEMAKLRVAERVSHGGHDIPVSRYRTAIPSKLGEPDRRLCVARGSDRVFAH